MIRNAEYTDRYYAVHYAGHAVGTDIHFHAGLYTDIQRRGKTVSRFTAEIFPHSGQEQHVITKIICHRCKRHKMTDADDPEC